MRLLLLALTLAASALLPAAAGAECLSSPEAVRAAHGISAWSSWRNINGTKCWMLGVRPGERRAEKQTGAPKKQAMRKPAVPQPQVAPFVPAAPVAAPPPTPVAPAAPVLAPDSIEFALALAKAKLVLADRLIQFQAQRRKEAAR